MAKGEPFMINLSHFGNTILDKAKQFVPNKDGNVGMLFGLCLLPVMAATGSAIDYSRASSARTHLQSAVDATTLALSKRALAISDDQLRREAEAFFKSNLTNNPELAGLPLDIRKSNKVLRISANAELQTAFMNLFGIYTMPISTMAETTLGQRKVEIALALDNTGSMRDFSKMDELKKATRNLIDAAEAAAPAGSGMIKIAIVPFDTEVKVDPNTYRNQSWLVFQDGANGAMFDDIRPRMATNSNAWTGCITDRGIGFDTNTKGVDLSRKESLHPGFICANENLAPIQPLTDNWNALRNAANRMQPTGWTNITMGVNFGMAALSPSEPIGAGVAYGTKDVDKYLVVLTDGKNTKNRYLSNGSDLNAPEIDIKTSAACDAIKGRSSSRDASGRPIVDSEGKQIPDVKIFTIRVIEGNQAVLRSCATNASMYKEVSNASEIDGVFKDIMREITQLKLTM
jgi:Flp pilus assembly protein TadG